MRVRDPERVPLEYAERNGNNVGFLAFIAVVVNCTAEMGL